MWPMWSRNVRSPRERVAGVSGVDGDPDNMPVSVSVVPHLLAGQSGRLVDQTGRLRRQPLVLRHSRHRAAMYSRVTILRNRERRATASADHVVRLHNNHSVLLVILVAAHWRSSVLGAGRLALSMMVLAVTHVTSGIHRRVARAATSISRALSSITDTEISSRLS